MKRKVRVFKGESSEYADVDLPEETSVTVYLNSKKLATIACSPQNPEELVLGFLFNEAIIEDAEDLKTFELDSSGNFWVVTKKTVSADLTRTRILTSGCTGAESIASELRALKPLDASRRFSSVEIMEFVEASLSLFSDGKRGLHRASALCESSQVVYAEDIGRHNALDRLAGIILKKGLPAPKFVFATGRLSSEMTAKSVRMRASAAISLSTPTSSAVALAESLNLIIIGYARRGSFTVYTFPERIY